MKLTVARKMYLGFGSVLLLLLFISGFSYLKNKSIETTYENLLDDRVQKMIMIRELIAVSKEIQIATRGYLLIDNDENIANYEKSKTKYDQISKDLASILVIETDKKLLQELDQINDQYIQLADELISLKKRNDSRYVDVISTQGPPIVIGFRNKAEEMMKHQTEVLTQEREATQEKVKDILNDLIVLSLVALLLGGGVSFYISRIISKPIIFISTVAEKIASGDLTQDEIQVKTKDEIADLAHAFNHMALNLRQLIQQICAGAEQVTSSSEELLATTEQATQATNQISSAIQEVASGSEAQVTSSQESSKAMEEVSIGIQCIAESSAMVSDSAQEATRLSEQGNLSIQKAIQQMDSIGSSAQNTATSIMQLTERSKEISKIIEVITGIADQTNLLALNAAIEAARAGEYGRGFAVVADEVRKLAEDSRSSAHQITELIKEIQKDTENANMNMENGSKEVILGKEIIQQTGAVFQNILKSVEQVNEQIQEVSANSEQIYANSQQVASSVDQLAQIAKEASDGSQSVAASSEEQLASMEEITSSSESLSTLAQELQGLVAKFKV